eukprot:g8906.t1
MEVLSKEDLVSADALDGQDGYFVGDDFTVQKSENVGSIDGGGIDEEAGSDTDTDEDPPPKSSSSKASTTNKQSGATGDFENKRNPKNGDDANDCDMYDAGKASECKEQGNVHFKQGEFALAVECYSDAISFSDPTAEPGSADGKQLAIYYANRAACYLSLNELEPAVHDCTDAIEYDPEYTRAWQRRCTASERRGKYSEALEDCKKLLELTPEKGVDGRTRTAEYSNLIKKQAYLKTKSEAQFEKVKDEMMGKLKDLGNTVLGKFGMSMDNFQVQQQDGGGYSINFKK